VIRQIKDVEPETPLKTGVLLNLLFEIGSATANHHHNKVTLAGYVRKARMVDYQWHRVCGQPRRWHHY
jgi:hypothetical protein